MTMARKTRMKFGNGFVGVALVMTLAGLSAMGQSTEKPAAVQTTEKPAMIPQDSPYGHVDPRPLQSFRLTNTTSQNDSNEVAVALRNSLDPTVKLFLVPSQNTIVMRGSADQIAMAQTIIKELDRPKRAYRLTYTITEIDGGKRIGVQHFSTIATEGQRSLVKQVSKVPIVTGSYNNGNSGNSPQGVESQVTYLDIGLIFDSTMDSYASGARLRSKVEQSSVAEERSGIGPQDPVVRSTSLEGTSFLMPGKPVILGSLDIPGSTRHLDVDVMMEPLTP